MPGIYEPGQNSSLNDDVSVRPGRLLNSLAVAPLGVGTLTQATKKSFK
jgi:hypothetical protein